jgi:hypothetical protein
MPLDPVAAPTDSEVNAQNLGYGAGGLGSGAAPAWRRPPDQQAPGVAPDGRRNVSLGPEPPETELMGPAPAGPQPAVAVGDRGDGRYEADGGGEVRARFTAPAAAPPEPLFHGAGPPRPAAPVEDIAAPMHESSVWDARPMDPPADGEH